MFGCSTFGCSILSKGLSVCFRSGSGCSPGLGSEGRLLSRARFRGPLINKTPFP